jgi:nucleolar protein 6
LALHHTPLDGRRINVEMTAGGGGNKSERRKQRLKDKNHMLHLMRV